MHRLARSWMLLVPILLGVAVCGTAAAATPSSAQPQLRYASTVPTVGGNSQALALVFANSFAPKGNFSDYIIVVDDQGNHVHGHWQVAKRHNVLLFPVPGPGTYHVILTPGLSSAQGGVLRTRYSGRLTVK